MTDWEAHAQDAHREDMEARHPTPMYDWEVQVIARTVVRVEANNEDDAAVAAYNQIRKEHPTLDWEVSEDEGAVELV